MLVILLHVGITGIQAAGKFAKKDLFFKCLRALREHYFKYQKLN